MDVFDRQAIPPLLLIVWRRPHTLSRVIDAIRPVAPPRIFVACDGPNPERPGEAEKVAATRALIDQSIDWPCQIEFFYSPTNQGCRTAVSRAISWFFDHVEQGIILEDDCIPHPDFFRFCDTLLEHYRFDTRVWSICGSNFQQGHRHGDSSYYFSIHGDSWGWATWRRAWQHYASAADLWPLVRDSGRFDDVFPIPEERAYWNELLDRTFIRADIDSWAFQWLLTSWINNGLHVWPNEPLISNIGFDSDGTHTFADCPEVVYSNTALNPLLEIIHPHLVLPSRAADNFAFFHRRFVAPPQPPQVPKGLKAWQLRLETLRSEGLATYLYSRLSRVLKQLRF